MQNTVSKQRFGSLKKVVSSNSIVLVVIAMIIAGTFAEGSQFLSFQNFMNILRNHAVIGIIALGMSFVIISGNIDLSVGAQMVAVAAITVSFVNSTGNIVMGLILGILAGCAMSTVTGIIVTKGRVPSFIVTLGMQYIYRSLCMFYMQGGGFYLDKTKAPFYTQISNYMLFGKIPMPVVYYALMFLLFWFISRYTKLGRHIYAVGSNEKATKLSGINTDKIKILAFTLMGLAISVAAIVESSRMGSINSTSSGNAYELNAIAMTVIGGISMEGGKGKISGALWGMLILGIINNMITLLGVNVYLINAFKGVIIIAAVLLQRKDREL
ncbi:MAG TPA: ABC transporter permease [Clostridiales bacterium]|nr:ABC transporter permease [Clostridiales bacterium]HOL91493.1 ABC transporter permease [Clostridiales bacterium]HPP35495.1 ABC transporter permease [Clostridiales bacterium]